MLRKFDEIQKEHKVLKDKNCQLKSDNMHTSEELKNLNSLIEQLNKLKVETFELKKECTSRKIGEEKLRELISTYVHSSISMDTLMAIQKSSGDKIKLGFDTSSSQAPLTKGTMFVSEYSPQPVEVVEHLHVHVSIPVEHGCQKNH